VVGESGGVDLVEETACSCCVRGLCRDQKLLDAASIFKVFCAVWSDLGVLARGQY